MLQQPPAFPLTLAQIQLSERRDIFRPHPQSVTAQGNPVRNKYGRDHHPRCFNTWMAGGGIKGGFSYGETDDFCYNVAKDPVHIRDLHATMLHLLGIDHKRLTFQYQGLDHRLTGVEPSRVVKEILA